MWFCIFSWNSIHKKYVLCVKKNQEENAFIILKVQNIITNHSSDKLFITGFKFKIIYNNYHGLYELLDDNFDLKQMDGENFNSLISVEPLIHCNIQNKNLFYFKTAPLEFY